MQGIPEYKDTGVLSLMEKASMAYGFEFFEWEWQKIYGFHSLFLLATGHLSFRVFADIHQHSKPPPKGEQTNG